MNLIVIFCLLLVALNVYSQQLNLQIYSGTSGQLQNSFDNWSWATVNLKDTTVVRSGSTYSISVVIANSAAAYFHGDFYVTVGTLSQLSFWINGGSNGNQDVVLHIVSSGNAVGQGLSVSTLIGAPIPANKWVQVTVPFSQFQAPDVLLNGIQFQAGTSNNEGTIYLDDISFTGSFPRPVPVTLTLTNTRQTVSPYIYGGNFASPAQLKSIGYTVNRWGGNAVTRYDYVTDSENHASDWYFENLPNDVTDPSKLPVGSQSYKFIQDAMDNKAAVLLTTPTIGWRPIDRQKKCGFSVAKYGQQQKTDPYDSDCGNGVKPDGTDITGNDPTDTSIATDPSYNVNWINFLDKSFGVGKVRWFQMDNEPGLWHETHRDVHPAPMTYDELWNRTLLYGGALKKAYPDSLIFGPISWGWCAYMYSPADSCTSGNDRKAHGDLPIIQWYMQQIANYKKTNNIQVVDVIDIHFYPQEPNVDSNKEDALTALLRLRSPRNLWDPNYSSESWVGQPIYILKRINDWIAAINPGGFKTAVSEYNLGDDSLITTGLAQVDILGVFARENVYVATRWVTPTAGTYSEDAFRFYLNYDGKGSKVEGDYILTNTTNLDIVTGHSYIDTSSRKLYVVIVNHVSSGSVPVSIDVSSVTNSGLVDYYIIAENQHLKPAGLSSVSNGKFDYEAPQWSATLSVVKY